MNSCHSAGILFAASTAASREPNREPACKDLAAQGGTEQGHCGTRGEATSVWPHCCVDGTCTLSCAGVALASCSMGLQPCLCFLTLHERTSRTRLLLTHFTEVLVVVLGGFWLVGFGFVWGCLVVFFGCLFDLGFFHFFVLDYSENSLNPSALL